VPLDQFARDDLPVEAVRVERLPDDAPVTGTPTTLHIVREPGSPERLLAVGGNGDAFLDPAVLTRRRIAPWVYPLVPFAAAFDGVAVPVLLFFAPAVIIPGD
jgi:hypothetical protein